MIKRYEVEEIIARALEELNGVFSKPDENGNCSLYEATVEDKDSIPKDICTLRKLFYKDKENESK